LRREAIALEVDARVELERAAAEHRERARDHVFAHGTAHRGRDQRERIDLAGDDVERGLELRAVAPRVHALAARAQRDQALHQSGFRLRDARGHRQAGFETDRRLQLAVFVDDLQRAGLLRVEQLHEQLGKGRRVQVSRARERVRQRRMLRLHESLPAIENSCGRRAPTQMILTDRRAQNEANSTC
jgi:hypothetical protein